MTDHFWLSQFDDFDPINQMISLSAIKSSGFHLVPFVHISFNISQDLKKNVSVSMLLGGVRGKKKKAGGSTRNKVNPYLEFSNYLILILYLTFVVIRPVPAQNYSFIEWK